MRWHLAGTVKTYLHKKNLRETPTNNRDIGQVPYEHIKQVLELIMEPMLEPIRIVNPSNFVLKKAIVEISLYI